VSAVRLAPAHADDARAIAELERSPENVPFLWARSEAEHRETMTDPDVRYFRIEDAAGAFIGFVQLTGLSEVGGSVRLRRIVMNTPGRGLGQRVMVAVGTLVFDEWRMTRLWLDVFQDNARARHVYESVGFRETSYSHPPTRPRRDGGAAPLIRMELWAKEYRAGSPR
jgi:diamine N-acetyltransferase